MTPENIPAVPESSDSALFSEIRVISEIPGTVSQQNHEDESWLRGESQCDAALQKADILLDIWAVLTVFLLFSVFFAQTWMWRPAWDYRNDPNNTEVFDNESTVTSKQKPLPVNTVLNHNRQDRRGEI